MLDVGAPIAIVNLVLSWVDKHMDGLNRATGYTRRWVEFARRPGIGNHEET